MHAFSTYKRKVSIRLNINCVCCFINQAFSMRVDTAHINIITKPIPSPSESHGDVNHGLAAHEQDGAAIVSSTTMVFAGGAET